MDQLDRAEVTSLALLALVAVGVVVLAAAGRAVAGHERVVVTRWGRVVRVAGPGLALRVPVLERWRTVSLQPSLLRMDVSAISADGVPVHVHAEASGRVVDPAQSLQARPDPLSASQSLVESLLAREIGRTDVTGLLVLRVGFESDVAPELEEMSSTLGVRVDDIEISDIEVRLTMSLLESLRHGAGSESTR